MYERKINLSVGIFAYNEEKNIENVITSLYNQERTNFLFDEVRVYSAGSTDKTDEITINLAKKYENLYLITQDKRQGIAHDINKFLSQAKNEILVIVNADIVVDKNCFKNLCQHFIDDNRIGLVQPHCKLNAPAGSLIDSAVQYQRSIANYFNSIGKIKAGELFMFRKIFSKIPNDIICEDGYITHLIKSAGYKIIYEPRAIIYNTGPNSVKDYLKQRRRVINALLDLNARSNFKPGSMDSVHVGKSIINTVNIFSIKEVYQFVYFLNLELLSRTLGYYDYHLLKKRPVVWDIVDSTKNAR